MSETTQYDPERHDNQIMAAFDTVDVAGAARDQLVQAGIERSLIHIVAKDEEPVAAETVGDQIMTAFMGLFSSSEHHEYEQAVHHGHALLAVTVGPGVDRHRVVEILEQNGALDFEAQRDPFPPSAPATDVGAPAQDTARRPGQREPEFGSNRVRSYITDRDPPS